MENDIEEVWMQVKGFEGLYEISNTYKIISLIKQRLLKISNKDGYGVVRITDYDNKPHMKRVHVLMAIAFIPNPNNYPLVRHLDDNKSNNTLSNLAWGTKSENALDAIKNKKAKVSENHHRAKLSSQNILDIKRMFNEGKTREELANLFGVSKRHISAVKNETKRKYEV